MVVEHLEPYRTKPEAMALNVLKQLARLLPPRVECFLWWHAGASKAVVWIPWVGDMEDLTMHQHKS